MSILDWWARSGIPAADEEAVARTASANGHVNMLQQWKACKGDKMQFDSLVLVGPTRNGHVECSSVENEAVIALSTKNVISKRL